jgi:hypothetical protein
MAGSGKAQASQPKPSEPASARAGTALASDPTLAAPEGAGQADAKDAEDQDEPKEAVESPFDRTQRILEELQRKRSGEAVEEPEPVAQAAEAPSGTSQPGPEDQEEEEAPHQTATAFDRTQEILENLMKRRSGAAKKQETSPAVREEAAVARPERAPKPGKTPQIDPGDFAQLSAQVSELRAELEALRSELQALRSAASELPIEEAA